MNLEQVVQRAKADIAKKYVYVMMPIPQLETLLNGLEELQRENEGLLSASKYALEVTDRQLNVEIADNIRLRTENAAMKQVLEFYANSKNSELWTGIRAIKVLSTLTKEEPE